MKQYIKPIITINHVIGMNQMTEFSPKILSADPRDSAPQFLNTPGGVAKRLYS